MSAPTAAPTAEPSPPEISDVPDVVPTAQATSPATPPPITPPPSIEPGPTPVPLELCSFARVFTPIPALADATQTALVMWSIYYGCFVGFIGEGGVIVTFNASLPDDIAGLMDPGVPAIFVNPRTWYDSVTVVAHEQGHYWGWDHSGLCIMDPGCVATDRPFSRIY